MERWTEARGIATGGVLSPQQGWRLARPGSTTGCHRTGDARRPRRRGGSSTTSASPAPSGSSRDVPRRAAHADRAELALADGLQRRAHERHDLLLTPTRATHASVGADDRVQDARLRQRPDHRGVERTGASPGPACGPGRRPCRPGGSRRRDAGADPARPRIARTPSGPGGPPPARTSGTPATPPRGRTPNGSPPRRAPSSLLALEGLGDHLGQSDPGRLEARLEQGILRREVVQSVCLRTPTAPAMSSRLAPATSRPN